MEKLALLKKHFGYESFRFGQEDIIDQIGMGRDCLAIMPTGGGKSLCYQLPALMATGVTIVVSPLIALMKDQVDSLLESGIAATYLNSTLTARETRERIDAVIAGEYKLVYVAPERLLTDSFYYLSQGINVSLIAVDEAHCISQWGHDFRPSYRNIPQFISYLHPRPTVTAFTATATSHVIGEIKELLELNNPYELTTGFDRENLFYQVVKPKDKYGYLKKYLSNDFTEGSGIIYCSTRKTVESLSTKLAGHGFSVGAYHGGMDSDERSRVQESFMMDDTSIIVATNAFGMGIDKPDVRFVIHYNMPKNMEAYYQEAGRAGRDGKNSRCILMYSPSDIVKQKMLIAQNAFDPERDRMQRANLQILVNYCHTNDCLRSEIVKYFGESPKSDNCASCGNCLDSVEYVDMSIEAQKILSCIYRTNQRFGTAMIIKVLRGSKDQQIKKWQLDKVSTYGIITDHSEGALRELVMNLIARGFISMTVDQYPILKLNGQSKSVLKGEVKILVRRENIEVKDTKKRKQKRKTDFDFDQSLYEQLVDKRKELAVAKGVPPYVIFANAVLEELAYVMPTSKGSFLDVKGIGEKKYESYGQHFMDIILAFKSDNNIDDSKVSQRHDELYEEVTYVENSKNRYEQTLEVYKENLSLEEIASKRGLTVGTIINHLGKLHEQGEAIDFDQYIDHDKKMIIESLIAEHGTGSIKVLKDQAPDTISYLDINVVLAQKNKT